jgi:hypothetical protein
MEHRRWRWLLPTLIGLLMIVNACSRAVPGAPSAAPGSAAIPPAESPAGGTAVGSAVVSAVVSASASPPRARAPALESDVLADECLLDAAQLGALLGRPVRVEQSVVRRDDGTRSTSCYAGAVDGKPAPLAAINVYRVRSGTPTEFVRAAGGRTLSGAGEGATLLETAAGPTLQVAAPAFLVTLVVQGRSPPDDAWRAAARTALARLPS